jgi:hypothetical protein
MKIRKWIIYYYIAYSCYVHALDTCIHAVGRDPSDARKGGQMRALHRAWDSYAAQSSTDQDQHDLYHNATRFMIKNMEHTWGQHEHGLDYKSNDWTNAGFKGNRDIHKGYAYMESTWWEQRMVGVDWTTAELSNQPSHPLTTLVKQELSQYAAASSPAFVTNPAGPAAVGFKKADPAAVLSFGGLEVGFDATTGEMTHLQSKSQSWASKGRPLLGLDYRVYSQDDFKIYQPAYSGLPHPPSWFGHDFGKPGDDSTKHMVYSGRLVSFWTKSTHADSINNESAAVEALVEIALNDTSATVLYGGAQKYWWHVVLSSQSVSATLTVENKTATRHPEAMFVRFNPIAVSTEMDKLGQASCFEISALCLPVSIIFDSYT